MPDTWTPIFDLSTPEKVGEVYQNNRNGDRRHSFRGCGTSAPDRHMAGRTPAFLTEWIAQPLYDRQVRRTSHLHVEDSCIGCGLCAKKCPVQAHGNGESGKPVWVKEKMRDVPRMPAPLPQVRHSVWEKYQKAWAVPSPYGKALISRRTKTSADQPAVGNTDRQKEGALWQRASWLCGLNGCGKSTLRTRALAEKLGLYFIDNENLYFSHETPPTSPCRRPEPGPKRKRC